jgi:hypothetical protein
LIAVDEYTGVETRHDYDYLTDKTTISYHSDAQAVLDDNHRLANDPEYWKKGMKNDFVKYASIPAGVQLKWMIEKGVDVFNQNHGKEVLALVNSPDYRYLKTTTKVHK